jgi:hypothetical protein
MPTDGRPMRPIDAFTGAQLERLSATAPLRQEETDFTVLDRLLMSTVLQPAVS